MRNNQIHSHWLYQHHTYLFAYALGRTGDEELAKDLVQETYLAALECQDTFGERSSLRTWLVAILKHKTCDAYRKKTMERLKAGILTEEPCQDMFAAHYELIPLIKKTIKKLPPVWQRVFTMNDLEERPATEICQALNLSPANYWVISHRVRRSLRESLRAFI